MAVFFQPLNWEGEGHTSHSKQLQLQRSLQIHLPTNEADSRSVPKQRQLTGMSECGLGLCCLTKPPSARPPSLSPQQPSLSPSSVLGPPETRAAHLHEEYSGCTPIKQTQNNRVSFCSRQKTRNEESEPPETPCPLVLGLHSVSPLCPAFTLPCVL